HQAAQTMMRGTLEAQQAVDHLVPQRSRVDPLEEEIQAGRDLEPSVTKNRTNEIVRKHFGPMRSQCDRALSLRGLNAGIDGCRRFRVVVSQRGQVGVENACGNGADSHDGLPWVELDSQASSYYGRKAETRRWVVLPNS